MSTSNPRSILKLMKAELDKSEKMKTEMEKVAKERDSWKREAEESRFYKTRVRELEDWMLKASTLHSDSPPIPPSTKRRKKSDASISGTKKEASISRIYSSGIARTVKGVTYKFTTIINNIKNNLSKENLEKFESSCFGHLLEIDKLQFQGHVVLQLLMHMDLNSSDTEKLVFKINNTDIQFEPRDFSVITGLRLGTPEEAMESTTSASSIENNFFMGKSKILLKDIEDLFVKVSCVGGEESDTDHEMTILQLALLYFLYGIVLAGNHTKRIDHCYFDLIDDLEKFNAFPWGRVAYESLASTMLSARSSMYNAGSKVAQASPFVYKIFGFSFALLVWAYEVMPSLAQYCAVRRVNNLKGPTPRILHWSTLKKRIYFKNLDEFFTPGDEGEPHLELRGIRATPWELEALRGGNIIPQPRKEKSVTNAAKPTSSAKSPTHRPARVSTQGNANVAQAEKQKKPLVGECSRFVAGDVICISDDDDDDEDDDDDDEDDSDDESLTNSIKIGELISKIKRET